MKHEKPIAYGPWTIRVDVAATRKAYKQIAQGGAEDCGCEGCRNFVLAREEAYEPETLRFLREAGIDYRKEGEAYDLFRSSSGKRLYGGWFFLVGMIEKSPEGTAETRLSRSCQLSFCAASAPRPQCFRDRPCVEVNFCAEVPWRSNYPEPD